MAAVDEGAGREALLEMEHAGATLVQSSQLAPSLKAQQRRQREWEAMWPEEWEGAAEP